MQDSQHQSDPITLVISEVVEPNRIREYEDWTRGINRAARQFDGFLGVEIIRPRDHAYPEYVVIVKFDDYDHYRNWITSAIYQQWMEKSYKFIWARSLQELPDGIELWFTLPKARSNHPPYYKKVILGVLAVYPLTQLSNLLLNPFLQKLPPSLSLLISVVFVSALLTYPVMPWLTEILNFWLYPSLPKQYRRNGK